VFTTAAPARVVSQQEVPAKTNEIPGLLPAVAGAGLAGYVLTMDALHTQTGTARALAEDQSIHYFMFIKASQPSLFRAVQDALAGPHSDFTEASWTQEGKGHGRHELRGIRTAPAGQISWPHAAQVARIRRDSGPTQGPWTSKEIACAITSLPPDLAGPRQLAAYARLHWNIENREHYVRDVTFREDSQRAHTGSQPTPTSPAPAAITAATTSASRPLRIRMKPGKQNNRSRTTTTPGPWGRSR
jgi:predicted transposase YbfD/YdcC